MKKKTKAKKKNVADATLRNVRAQNKRMKDIEARLERSEAMHNTDVGDHLMDEFRYNIMMAKPKEKTAKSKKKKKK